jgi:ribosomal protein S6--L-glutamate ligase
MLDDRCQKPVSIHLLLVPVAIEIADTQGCRALDFHSLVGNGKAALLVDALLVPQGQDPRIDHGDGPVLLLVAGRIDDDQPAGYAHLDGGQPNAGRSIHRLEHIVGKAPQIIVDPFDGGRDLAQKRVRKCNNAKFGHTRHISEPACRVNWSPSSKLSLLLRVKRATPAGGCTGSEGGLTERLQEARYAMGTDPAQFTIGWEEWVALPDLGLPAVKVKVDTGARTSALDAFQIEPFGPASAPMVRFGINPVPGRQDLAVYCSATLLDRREVTSSNGERETRYVIRTNVQMGERVWPIELTLANREAMAYRMLLGRQAIREDIRVDPAASFLQPKLSYRLYRHLPRQDLVHRVLRIALLTQRPHSPSSRRLAAAASARGHVLEALDTSLMALVFQQTAPALTYQNTRVDHYDAVVPRLGTYDWTFGTAAVRQFELMGSFAINPGDALERLHHPVSMRQALARHGIPVPSTTIDADGPQIPLKTVRSTPTLRFLVIGGDVVAVVDRRHGTDLDAGSRKLDDERSLAQRAARALDLGLLRVDIGETETGPAVLGVSGTPSLAEFEKTTGTLAAEQVIAHLENRARSWVRQTESGD